MKAEVKEYNKEKAVKTFLILKAEEIGVVLGVIFGFYLFGKGTYMFFPKVYYKRFGYSSSNAFEFWMNGVVIVCALLLVGLLLAAVVLLIYYWIESNWNRAKKLSETPESKKQRLKEQKIIDEIEKIEELDEQRRKWGYCVGDILEQSLLGDNDIPLGSKFRISDIDSDGEFEIEGRDGWYTTNGCKVIKKIKIPKKPKLPKE